MQCCSMWLHPVSRGGISLWLLSFIVSFLRTRITHPVSLVPTQCQMYGFPSVNKHLSYGMDLKLVPMWIALFLSGSNLAKSLFRNHQ